MIYTRYHQQSSIEKNARCVKRKVDQTSSSPTSTQHFVSHTPTSARNRTTKHVRPPVLAEVALPILHLTRSKSVAASGKAPMSRSPNRCLGVLVEGGQARQYPWPQWEGLFGLASQESRRSPTPRFPTRIARPKLQSSHSPWCEALPNPPCPASWILPHG